MIRDRLCLYAVTDRTWLYGKNLCEQLEQALKGGVSLVQLREKSLSGDAFLKEAKEVKCLCDRYHVPLILNDHVEAVALTGAAGVHIGQHDMEVSEARKLLGKDKIIGASARTIEQAKKAQKDGADYLGAGAVFGTRTKSDAEPITKELLTSICSAVTIPVVAIGGISRENIMELQGTGICGVAVVSAIFAEKDALEAARELRKKAERIWASGVKNCNADLYDRY